MRTLVVNVGSSSLKLSVLDGGKLVTAENLPRDNTDEIRKVIEHYGPIDAVGHRIVHGGPDFTAPVVVDGGVRRRLDALVDLAPLHLPKSLDALDLFSGLLPDAPAVACFDTAFHAGMPDAASTYGLPDDWRQRWRLRRYGFHGISHAWATRRAGELVGVPEQSLRIVTCHLGAGASLAAVAGGRSVDTTMGFTPLEGLVMATRSGSVDPGLVLWLETHAGLPPDELAATLEERSGLLGLAGNADMRTVLDAEERGDEAATLAIAVYLHRLRAGIASMVAALGGLVTKQDKALDVVVFTGGVGERSAPIRARAAAGLGFLGIEVDGDTNDAARPDTEISAAGAAVRTFVIEAREDLQIDRDVTALLG